jgi:dipeptidyl-peptidase-3
MHITMKKIPLMLTGTMLCLAACEQGNNSGGSAEFCYTVERFADLEVLRYQVPGFEQLSLPQKKLVYFLSQAALEGRDILYCQNSEHNLAIRRTLEAVYQNYAGDTADADYKNLVVYLKRVWFANGIHHHYGADKFVPGFSSEFFASVVKSLPPERLPLRDGQTVEQLLAQISPTMFDPALAAKRVNQRVGDDLVVSSAMNFYSGVTQREAEKFYADMKARSSSETPASWGLNSRLVKRDGQLVEEVWKLGGLYSAAIEKIVYWLAQAEAVAESEHQRSVIAELRKFYETGDLTTFDAYSISWVADTSRVDFINGFIETYGDPIDIKGTWEAMVNFKNLDATRRTEVISANAQWFEDNSPVEKRFKKELVKGVSAKVINAAILAGDCYPATPIGINLPNANWIRAAHGSKSVTIQNITEAYDKAAQGNGFAEEFYWSSAEVERTKRYGHLTDNLHTDLHECLGHASGKLLPGVTREALLNYGSCIEEARADLFALYYIADPKLVELGLLPDGEAYKAEYYKYVTNGLMTQLTRIEPGNSIQEAHMRNRALISHRVLELGAADKVVELVVRDEKTYVVVNDYVKLRALFGQVLADIQRIRSEGDFEGAKQLVEAYAVSVDPKLHAEVLARYAKLQLAPYKGFVNPVYEPETNSEGEITDVRIRYTEGYAEQMLRYSREHSWL